MTLFYAFLGSLVKVADIRIFLIINTLRELLSSRYTYLSLVFFGPVLCSPP